MAKGKEVVSRRPTDLRLVTSGGEPNVMRNIWEI